MEESIKAFPFVCSRTKYQNFIIDYLVRPEDFNWREAKAFVSNAMYDLSTLNDFRYAVFAVDNYCVFGVGCLSRFLVEKVKFEIDQDYLRDEGRRSLACFIGFAVKIPKTDNANVPDMVSDDFLKQCCEMYFKHLKKQWLKSVVVSEQIDKNGISSLDSKNCFVSLKQIHCEINRVETENTYRDINITQGFDKNWLSYYLDKIINKGNIKESFISNINYQDQWERLVFKNASVSAQLKSIISKEKRKTRFTALGMTNSGKTCYIIGMCYVMFSGEKGWTLITGDIATTDKLNGWLKLIDQDELGVDRFVTGTNPESNDNYRFDLYYCNKHIMSFDWIDYAGTYFENKVANVFEEVEKSIDNSTAIYIFIDGEELCVEEKRKKIKNIRRYCATYINPYIIKFVESHEYMPPVVFVITKSDLCRKYTDTEEIREILRESFSYLFYDKRAEIYITAVSLGDDIAEDDYHGECDPVNVQIPFFIGIHHELVRHYKSFNAESLEKEGALYRKMISNMTDALMEKSSFFEIVEGDIKGGHVKPFELEEWRVN